MVAKHHSKNKNRASSWRRKYQGEIINMNDNLAKTLVNKNIINTNTKLETRYLGQGLDGSFTVPSVGIFTVSAIKKIENIIIFTLVRNDGFKTIVPADNVLRIDGMDPVRLATVYNLKEDGSPGKISKKRGRKSKNDRQNG